MKPTPIEQQPCIVVFRWPNGTSTTQDCANIYEAEDVIKTRGYGSLSCTEILVAQTIGHWIKTPKGWEGCT